MSVLADYHNPDMNPPTENARLLLRYKPESQCGCGHCWKPSENIAQAMHIMEKVTERGLSFSMNHGHYDKGVWKIAFFSLERHYHSSADSLPHAIVKGAITATNVADGWEAARKLRR